MYQDTQNTLGTTLIHDPDREEKFLRDSLKNVYADHKC